LPLPSFGVSPSLEAKISIESAFDSTLQDPPPPLQTFNEMNAVRCRFGEKLVLTRLRNFCDVLLAHSHPEQKIVALKPKLQEYLGSVARPSSTSGANSGEDNFIHFVNCYVNRTFLPLIPHYVVPECVDDLFASSWSARAEKLAAGWFA
jgi:hypothetical protein